MSSKLQIKKEEPIEESLTCPSCGAPMLPGTVLCVQCGYDTRTKQKAGGDVKSKPSPLLIGALGVIILGAIVIVILRSLPSSSTPPPPPPQATAPAPAMVADTNTAEEVQAEATASEAAATESEPEVAQEETADTEEVIEEEEPTEPKVDWAAIEAEQLERATAALDARAPMHEIGEVVDLRMTNGIVQRGTFTAVNGNTLSLEVAPDDVRTVPMVALDRASRIRMEPDYREGYIQYVVRQRIMEMQRTAETNAP